MTYTLRLTVAPGIEPVTLDEAKAHIRQSGNADDALLTRIISAARSYVETETGRALITQTFEATFGEWPTVFNSDIESSEYGSIVPSAQRVPAIEIVKLPFGSVSGITAAGEAWTDFTAIKTARGVRIKPTSTIPDGEIVVTFTAGYGSTAALVPSDLSYAILMLVATLYDNPGIFALDTSGMKAATLAIPSFAGTLNRYRVMT